MSQSPLIVWFRNDLRRADNPALRAAANAGRPVVCLFVLDDETPGDWALGGAARWWLHASLGAFSSDLEKAGGRLILRRGRARDVVPAFAREMKAAGVYWNRRYDVAGKAEDGEIKETLKKQDLDARSFNGALLYEPWEIVTGSGGPYRVFTPFWKALRRAEGPKPPLPAVTKLQAPKGAIKSDVLDDWALPPTAPDWSGGLHATWTPGETGARKRLKAFLAGPIRTYGEDRNRPDRAGTSMLSPHLRFGEISPRTIWAETVGAMEAGDAPDGEAEKFLSEVAWREFSYSLLHYNEDFPEEPLQKKFAAFPWRQDEAHLNAWRRGRTGYPIVDAGMRQLWETGWMHNRVRMIVGSFLVKHLLLHWREGEDWFWDTLVDADLANNAAGWQWIGGCGADAAPYFRIFNPMTQGDKFDPDGAYVRRYVPELRDMPAKHIHQPWDAPAPVLEAAGVIIGKTYPAPIVDHAEARKRALAAYEQIK
ncbi:MAG: deoxyribodipyrimidine photo-lyase [Pseudomonadota bacterium]